MFELKRTVFGHLGVFPEQAAQLAVDRRADVAGSTPPAAPPRVLNLFAYTGGSTLAAAATGAEVVHVDAARNIVAWARRNAELSGLADAPIRWIAEDALKFVKRELRRGNRYDAVILDPPSYGHGAAGRGLAAGHAPAAAARICCGQLTAGRRRFMLLTCHTPEFRAGPAGADDGRRPGRRRRSGRPRPDRRPAVDDPSATRPGVAQRRGGKRLGRPCSSASVAGN